MTDLPVSLKNKIVFIHPGTMQLCGLAIGQLCIISESYVLQAWPNSNLPPLSIILPEFLGGCAEQEHQKDSVMVHRFFTNGFEAQEVEVELR